MSRGEIIAAIRDMGMVGLGGAEFPTYAKLATSMQHDIHTVIANGCECEPFITTDFRVMLENVQNLLLGMRIVMKAVAAEKGIIAIEDNKLEVLTALQAHLPEDGSIKVEVVETKYPQGAEQMLIYSLLGVALPKGKLPASLGLEVINVATVAEIGALLPTARASSNAPSPSPATTWKTPATTGCRSAPRCSIFSTRPASTARRPN